nr:hypothetical protein CFP56_06646 [Quercus suber]
MHTEGTKSSNEASQPENRNIVTTIEDLQCSQAATAKKVKSTVYINTRPPYPEEVAGRLYPVNYTPPIFPKYDVMAGNARVHIKRCVDALMTHSHDHELRLREFSKSLEDKLKLSDLQQEKQRVSERLLEYIQRLRELSLLCYDLVEKERPVDVCISDPRMHRPEVAMTFFMGHEDPTEEEVENMASSSSTPLPLQNEDENLAR